MLLTNICFKRNGFCQNWWELQMLNIFSYYVKLVINDMIKSARVDFSMLKLQCTAKVEQYLVVTISFSFLR